MAADLSLEPWSRLAKLAPPGTDPNDLQAAADRYALTADLYAAVADLWEEKAMSIDVSPDATPSGTSGQVLSVSQDGLSVTYKASNVEGDTQNARGAQYSYYMKRAQQFRAKAKVKTPLLDGRKRVDQDTPWDFFDPEQNPGYFDPDHIIPVIE